MRTKEMRPSAPLSHTSLTAARQPIFKRHNETENEERSKNYLSGNENEYAPLSISVLYLFAGRCAFKKMIKRSER
jgi:hypothetical protein